MQKLLERLGYALDGKWFLGEPLWNRYGMFYSCIKFHMICGFTFIVWLIVALGFRGAHFSVLKTGTRYLYDKWGEVDYVSMLGFALLFFVFGVVFLFWTMLLADRWYAKKYTTGIKWKIAKRRYNEIQEERSERK